MQKSSNSYIVITGAAGFIGSNLVHSLNKKGYKNLILVDHMTSLKKKNLAKTIYKKYYEKNVFLKQLDKLTPKISSIIHMGACSDTREYDDMYLRKNNFEYSKKLFAYATKNNCQFIYASSGSVYGDGSKGYKENTKDLKPLNPYGKYKYLFDTWVEKQKEKPFQCVGLRFFNVYGPRENHKGQMASVVYHGFNQIQKTGEIKLFKSYNKKYPDGKQKRDFIFVEDVISVIDYFLNHPLRSGIFNVGTGKTDTFIDLAKATFKAVRKRERISFIDMPETLKKKYQYFTKANIGALKKAGYKKNFTSLEKGIERYIRDYLLKIQ